MAKANNKKSLKRPRKTSGRMASKGFFNPIDIHVGQRIRARRTIMGYSQSTLGDMIGLTFQQVQKYERGANRVSSSRLFDLARVLEVPVSWFFEEMPGDVKSKSPAQVMDNPTPLPVAQQPDEMFRRETLELVRAYYEINPTTRKQLRELVKALS
ncbi:MAG: helix-turn-helix domain-containing protein [Proteobacteria bacterium]|nr:helix-turn-helix domain-containing protein [Pseudomonadota bacterium]